MEPPRSPSAHGLHDAAVAPDPELAEAAWAVRERARAPYSSFRVGAALRTESGAVVAGCNVENGSYGLTMCAERVALFTAVAAGATGVRELVLVSDDPGPLVPCGACRQVMAELAPAARIWMGAPGGVWRHTSVPALLPDAFAFRRPAG